VQRPIRMGSVSPRRTALNQTLDSSPIITSPTTIAPAAMKTVGWTSSGRNVMGTLKVSGSGLVVRDGRSQKIGTLLAFAAKGGEQLAHFSGGVGVALLAGFLDAATEGIAGFRDTT